MPLGLHNILQNVEFCASAASCRFVRLAEFDAGLADGDAPVTNELVSWAESAPLDLPDDWVDTIRRYRAWMTGDPLRLKEVVASVLSESPTRRRKRSSYAPKPARLPRNKRHLNPRYLVFPSAAGRTVSITMKRCGFPFGRTDVQPPQRLHRSGSQ